MRHAGLVASAEFDVSADKLRQAIFDINTRRFGTVCEAIIMKVAEAGRGRNQFHDLYCDKTQSRIEVKFSRVQKAGGSPDTVVSAILAELDENRTVEFSRWNQAEVDCNIQLNPAGFAGGSLS